MFNTSLKILTYFVHVCWSNGVLGEMGPHAAVMRMVAQAGHQEAFAMEGGRVGVEPQTPQPLQQHI